MTRIVRCDICEGRGYVTDEPPCHPGAYSMTRHDCDECGGEGTLEIEEELADEQ